MNQLFEQRGGKGAHYFVNSMPVLRASRYCSFLRSTLTLLALPSSCFYDLRAELCSFRKQIYESFGHCEPFIWQSVSEEAFRSLVDRHLPLVFGTARRMTRNPALAEDVAQAAFILLARKAKTLARELTLSGYQGVRKTAVGIGRLRGCSRLQNA